MRERIVTDGQSDVGRNQRGALRSGDTRLVWVGLGLTAALFAVEIVHYFVVTDLAVLDQVPSVSVTFHAQCKELESPFDLRCPFAGYNSVKEVCWGVQCVYGDPNLPKTTEERRSLHLAESHRAALDSLAVEAPFNSASDVWQQVARDLRKNKETETPPHHLSLTAPPETIPDAQIVIQERSQLLSRQIAEEWLQQHAR